MNILWDYECISCSAKKEEMMDKEVLAITCPSCNGQMVRVMGGRPATERTSSSLGPSESGTHIHIHTDVGQFRDADGNTQKVIAIGIIPGYSCSHNNRGGDA